MPGDLLLIRGFLDDATCRAVREGMDRGEIEPAEVLAGESAIAGEVRRAASVEVGPATRALVERRLDEQCDALAAYFGVELAGREGSGFLRYGNGDFYRPHRDRADVASWPGAARRLLTVVVFLNAGGFTGGVLRVGDDAVVPAAGLLVAFPADALHEVTTVRGGVRDAVVDWFLGPQLL